MEERKAFMTTLNEEYQRVYSAVKGRKMPTTEGADFGATHTVDDALSGALRNTRREAVTQQQQLQLEEINKEQKDQDDLLDQMSLVLGNLARVAHTIKDEVDKSNQVLDDTLNKVDDAAAQLDRVNDRMKDTLEKVRGRAGGVLLAVVVSFCCRRGVMLWRSFLVASCRLVVARSWLLLSPPRCVVLLSPPAVARFGCRCRSRHHCWCGCGRSC